MPPMMVPPPHLAPPDYDEATKSCAPPDYETATKSNEFKFVPNTPESRSVPPPPTPIVSDNSSQNSTTIEIPIGPKPESSDA